MDVTLALDCQSLVIGNSYVIDDMGTSNNQEKICNYALDVDYNCCTPNTYNVPANIQISSIAITACGSELFGGVITPYYDVQVVFNLEACCVESFTWYSVINGINNPTILAGENNTYTFRLYFLGGDIQAGDQIAANFDLLTKDGFTHQFEYTITGVVLPDHCLAPAISITDYVRPTIPTSYGITIDEVASTITLTDTSFGQNTDPNTTNSLLEGIYCITVKGENCSGVPLVDGGIYGQRLYSESVVYFVDCDDKIKCRIAQVAPTCDTADPIWIYETLIYNNTCQVLSCTDACNLYRKLLDYLNNNCAAPAKPCNCD